MTPQERDALREQFAAHREELRRYAQVRHRQMQRQWDRAQYAREGRRWAGLMLDAMFSEPTP
jgi:hypothetical protein